jgi:putative hemolysin
MPRKDMGKGVIGMLQRTDQFIVRFAQDAQDVLAAQKLRYRVFVEELGGSGAKVDHTHKAERDIFDDHAAHLLLIDTRQPQDTRVVGAYRLMTKAAAQAAGAFYSQSEYDLSPVLNADREVLEIGRSCLDAAYRGGTGLMHLWSALAAYVQETEIETIFGVASFHGADPVKHALALSYLHANYLADEDIRPRSKSFHPMAGLPLTPADRKRALQDTPSLIKAYLRLGGQVGEGAFIDRACNTVDVWVVLDTGALTAR